MAQFLISLLALDTLQAECHALRKCPEIDNVIFHLLLIPIWQSEGHQPHCFSMFSCNSGPVLSTLDQAHPLLNPPFHVDIAQSNIPLQMKH